MINPEVIAEQIRRLCAIFKTTFPSDQIAQRELFHAFEKACENDQQVREVADYLAHTCRFCPVPADVHRAREALSESKAYNREAPSYRYAPGSFEGNLADGMTIISAGAIWPRMARNISDWSRKQWWTNTKKRTGMPARAHRLSIAFSD